MKYFTEKERNEILALTTLVASDYKNISDFAVETLENIETIGIEVEVDEETIIGTRAFDDNSILADYIVVYDEQIAKHIGCTEDFAIKITIINLLTGEIIFDASYTKFNKGEAVQTSESCMRSELSELI